MLLTRCWATFRSSSIIQLKSIRPSHCVIKYEHNGISVCILIPIHHNLEHLTWCDRLAPPALVKIYRRVSGCIVGWTQKFCNQRGIHSNLCDEPWLTALVPGGRKSINRDITASNILNKELKPTSTLAPAGDGSG